MNKFFRALIAGYGAKKLGGGCLGTVLVFIVIWVALGQCSWRDRYDTAHRNYKTDHAQAEFVRFKQNEAAVY
jgi:hypothetical protein